MALRIQSLEYRSGFLAPDAGPESWSVQTWRWEQIPSELRKALSRVSTLRLHGVYGARPEGRRCEYDQLRMIWEHCTVTIDVFDRAVLAMSSDAR